MLRDRTTVKRTPGLFLQPYVVAQLSGALIVQVVEGSDVTATEYALTSWLALQRSATPSQLAHELGVAPTTLSAMIDRLAQKGQIRRVPHPGDGRSYLLELTPRGRATNLRNSRRLERVLAEVRAELDADPEEILEEMRRLEAALRRVLQ
ncbi:MAG TPA: MarR family transcriptional regulator [Gaiellaceae bacterium]|jgi:MarR family multiple antibiotic resistance transcriptional regulator